MDLIRLNYKLILGSQSPRRKELLSALDLPFNIRLPQVEEVFPKELSPERVPEYLAKLKLDHLLKTAEKEELIICSDTIVLLGNDILEKPKNESEAFEMLRALSGKKHVVLTSVAMGNLLRSISFTDSTEVEFNVLSDEEIHYYIKKYQPFDKAGSYGVQDWIGMVAIKSMNGSFYTVMGLPIHLVYQELKNWE